MWKDKYKVHVPIIDQQHEELFIRVFSFIEIVQQKGNWEDKITKIKDTLEFMQDYVVFHFDDEEKYQEKINYPHIEIHKQRHQKFKEAINAYAQRFESEGFHEELVQEFGGKLMTWLILHIQVEDQKLGEYAKNTGGYK